MNLMKLLRSTLLMCSVLAATIFSQSASATSYGAYGSSAVSPTIYSKPSSLSDYPI